MWNPWLPDPARERGQPARPLIRSGWCHESPFHTKWSLGFHDRITFGLAPRGVVCFADRNMCPSPASRLFGHPNATQRVPAPALIPRFLGEKLLRAEHSSSFYPLATAADVYMSSLRRIFAGFLSKTAGPWSGLDKLYPCALPYRREFSP